MLRKIVNVILMITLTSLSLHAVAVVGAHAPPASTAVSAALDGEHAAAHHHEQVTVAVDEHTPSFHDGDCAAGGHCCLAIPSTLLPPLAKHHAVYVPIWHVLPVAADSPVHTRPPITSL